MNINSGDTAFMLVATALVMLMTPGLALFYGGMARKKHVLNTIMMSLAALGLISVQWVVFGYTLSFGPDWQGIIGGLEHLGLQGLADKTLPVAPSIPAFVFMAFQLMFAIITPALISGAIAERMRFGAYLLFILLWATLIYDPLAHWVWGGGWLAKLGALDFAGGLVVHISSGVSGLVAALVLGKRRGYGHEPMAPHQVPMTVLGAGLLWFGWFGFNAGSALGANATAALALVTTNTAAAAAALAWMFLEWLHHGKPTALGVASGAVAGLVAITPAAGFVSVLSALAIGAIGGAVCYFGVAILKKKLGYDDALDAFGCHGLGGTWGAIATGIFAMDGGLISGKTDLLQAEIISVAATYLFAGIGTYLILKAINLFLPLRVEAEEEVTGLDLTQHGEEAYPDFTLGGPLSSQLGMK
ncbi:MULTISPECIES: ammonium transporter [unclassified Carboxydocella]|uniref:ammonium transporter n=1 Tax=unclassified Carboxydocella TaxID=2685367 RepID=UPI0009AD1FAC|nr:MULTISPECIES: ammonium transporter [unclassified Carboxydocella]AVX31879.1 ammonium transporter [Carboxydocella thermautotrophica]GAW28525.1 ammonia channel protein [Carboxydocella sp. ULO1]